jgi:hypothetical protein
MQNDLHSGGANCASSLCFSEVFLEHDKRTQQRIPAASLGRIMRGSGSRE